jgi:hypothetical protein
VFANESIEHHDRQNCSTKYFFQIGLFVIASSSGNTGDFTSYA